MAKEELILQKINSLQEEIKTIKTNVEQLVSGSDDWMSIPALAARAGKKINTIRNYAYAGWIAKKGDLVSWASYKEFRGIHPETRGRKAKYKEDN